MLGSFRMLFRRIFGKFGIMLGVLAVGADPVATVGGPRSIFGRFWVPGRVHFWRLLEHVGRPRPQFEEHDYSKKHVPVSGHVF